MFPCATARAAIKNGWVAAKVDTRSEGACTRVQVEKWDLGLMKDAATILKAGNKSHAWLSIHDKLFDAANNVYKEDFFNNGEVQRKLIKGIIEGTLYDKSIMDALAQETCKANLHDKDTIVQSMLGEVEALLHKQPNMHFIFKFFHGLGPDAQNKLADALLAGRFEANADVLQAIAVNMAMFTDPKAILKVARAIRKKKFGNDDKVLKAILGKIDHLVAAGTNDYKAQQELAFAIQKGAFGTHPGVLVAVAERFNIFRNPAAQKTVAQAISSIGEKRAFGSDPNVLRAVATNLHCFTATEAQSEIVIALLGDVFGTDPLVLREVAGHLRMFSITINPRNFANSKGEITAEMMTSLAQSVAADLKMQFTNLSRIAEAICKRKFGDDTLAQREVATHLDIFKPVTADVASIVFAKFEGEVSASASFGPAVIRLKEESETKKIHDALQAGIVQQQDVNQLGLVNAFSQNSFIADPDVQRMVAQNLTLFNADSSLITDARQINRRDETQKKLLAFVSGGYFTDPQAKLDSQEFLAKYIEQGQLSDVVVAEGTLLETVVRNFCATRDLAPNTVISLLSALASGKFDFIDPVLQNQLKDHLQSLLSTARAITEAVDSAAKKKSAIQFSNDANSLALLPVQIFLAQSINNIDFDTNNAHERVALEAIVRKFCEPGVNISPEMTAHLQQAWYNKRFATIDPTLKAQFQAKLKIWSTLGKAVVVASSVLSVIGAAAGAYSYYYYFNGNAGGES